MSRDPSFSELYSNPKAKLITATDLISFMDRYEIDISVVLNFHWCSREITQETNDYIVESVNKYPSRLAGFFSIPLSTSDFDIVEVERCAKAGLKGVGELRLNDRTIANPESLKALVQQLQKYDLLMLIHVSEPVGHAYPGKGTITPEKIYPLLTTFSNLKTVCSHWGGGLPFYTLMPEVKCSTQNVFFDSAASPFLYSPEIYKHVSKLVGADKILFGTDFPLISPKRLLDEVSSSELTQREKKMILSENALSLLQGIK